MLKDTDLTELQAHPYDPNYLFKASVYEYNRTGWWGFHVNFVHNTLLPLPHPSRKTMKFGHPKNLASLPWWPSPMTPFCDCLSFPYSPCHPWPGTGRLPFTWGCSPQNPVLPPPFLRLSPWATPANGRPSSRAHIFTTRLTHWYSLLTGLNLKILRGSTQLTLEALNLGYVVKSTFSSSASGSLALLEKI